MAALGTLFMDVVKEKLGLAEDEAPAQTEQVIQQPQDIIINIPEQKKDTVVKKVYVKPKPKKTETEKRKDEGLDW
jgi:flagellar motility protein MotE (MotC chaperone)